MPCFVQSQSPVKMSRACVALIYLRVLKFEITCEQKQIPCDIVEIHMWKSTFQEITCDTFCVWKISYEGVLFGVKTVSFSEDIFSLMCNKTWCHKTDNRSHVQLFSRHMSKLLVDMWKQSIQNEKFKHRRMNSVVTSVILSWLRDGTCILGFLYKPKNLSLKCSNISTINALYLSFIVRGEVWVN